MSKQIEEWRPVVGYEGLYEVSDWGNVRSVDRIIVDKNGRKMHYKGRILKTATQPISGYKMLLLGVKHPAMVHRLVAKAFIPNPENKLEVDNIIPISNGGTDEVWNLRWVTAKENANNPYSAAKRHRNLTDETKKKISDARKGNHYPKLSEAKKGKPNPKLSAFLKGRENKASQKKVHQFTKNGEFIKEWKKISDANEELKICSSSISACCKGKLKSTGGYIWKYASISH